MSRTRPTAHEQAQLRYPCTYCDAESGSWCRRMESAPAWAGKLHASRWHAEYYARMDEPNPMREYKQTRRPMQTPMKIEGLPRHIPPGEYALRITGAKQDPDGTILLTLRFEP